MSSLVEEAQEQEALSTATNAQTATKRRGSGVESLKDAPAGRRIPHSQWCVRSAEMKRYRAKQYSVMKLMSACRWYNSRDVTGMGVRCSQKAGVGRSALAGGCGTRNRRQVTLAPIYMLRGAPWRWFALVVLPAPLGRHAGIYALRNFPAMRHIRNSAAPVPAAVAVRFMPRYMLRYFITSCSEHSIRGMAEFRCHVYVI